MNSIIMWGVEKSFPTWKQLDFAYLTPADLACSAELQKSGTFSGSVKACRHAVKGILALTGSGGARMFSSASLRLASYASSSSGNIKTKNKELTPLACPKVTKSF